MNPTLLREKVQESRKNRTPEQRKDLLIKANILDSTGVYDSRFFSTETVKASKERKLGTS